LNNEIGKPKDIKSYVEELLILVQQRELYEKLKNWEVPRFPINGKMLQDKGCPSGKIMGIVMNSLKKIWTQHEFNISSDELFNHLPKVYEDLNISDGKQNKKIKTK
jgi:hypothetical protein